MEEFIINSFYFKLARKYGKLKKKNKNIPNKKNKEVKKGITISSTQHEL